MACLHLSTSVGVFLSHYRCSSGNQRTQHYLKKEVSECPGIMWHGCAIRANTHGQCSWNNGGQLCLSEEQGTTSRRLSINCNRDQLTYLLQKANRLKVFREFFSKFGNKTKKYLCPFSVISEHCLTSLPSEYLQTCNFDLLLCID